MKIARIALLLVIMMLALTVMTGCRLKPFKEDWYFFSYKEDVTFLGGVTLNMGFSDASHVYPFAEIENDNIGISFSKDGKVEFTPKDGITRYGTYTYYHKGNYTSFVITLENGETVEGSSMKTLKEKKLSLTYQGIVYNFTAESKRVGINTDTVVAKIFAGDYGDLNEAAVLEHEGGYAVRFSEMIYYPLTSETAVCAVQINKDGSYEYLSELRVGNVLSTYVKGADYVIIYYVEK